MNDKSLTARTTERASGKASSSEGPRVANGSEGRGGLARASLQQDSIRIRGARVHNLKNISLEIPHDQLTVVTGVSGSGKSSLAFDTIYAEGQRRYVESLSAYARQFLERMEKPDVDEIDGIAPPVAIRQKNTTRNPRSTVATSTELYDFLRLLWARAGRTYLSQLRHPRAARFGGSGGGQDARAAGGVALVRAVSAAAGRRATDALRDRLFDLRKKGFNRLYQAGNGGRIFHARIVCSDVDFSKPVFVLVDRIAISPRHAPAPGGHRGDLLSRSGRSRFRGGAGRRAALRFSEKFACKRCGKEFADPEPNLFSFNSPAGRLPPLPGLRQHHRLRHGSGHSRIAPCRCRKARWIPGPSRSTPGYLADFRRTAKGKVRFNVPVFELREDERAILYEAIRRYFQEIETKKYKVHVRVFMSRYRGYTLCPDCGGSRLRAEALWVRVGGKNLAEVVRLNIAQAIEFFHCHASCPRKRPRSPKRCWWRFASASSS